MRRVAIAIGLAAFLAVLLVVGWQRWPSGETTTSGATSATEATTVPPATTTTVPPADLVAVPAEEVVASGFDPLLAISAGEAWTVVNTLEDFACVVARYRDAAWDYWGLTDGARIRDLTAAPDGTVWAATDSGAFSFDGQSWTRRFDGPTGGVAVDGQGAVWIAGNLEGDLPAPWLARGDGEQWERLDASTQSPQTGSASMALGPAGEAWVAIYPGYRIGDLLHFDGTAVQAVQIADIPDPAGAEGAVAIYTIEAAPDGSLWIGGYLNTDWDEPVLARFDGSGWALHDWPGDHTDNPVLHFQLAPAPDGVLWMGSELGVAFFDGTEWTWPSIQAAGWVVGIDVAPDGTVWYSDDAGLHTVDIPPWG